MTAKEYAAAWYKANKERHAAKCKAWRERNKARLQMYFKEYALKNAEKKKTQRTLWREKNPSHNSDYYHKNPEVQKARTATWRKNNPEAHRRNQRNRLARRLNAPGRGVSAGDWNERLVEFSGRCGYCLNETSTLQMDHMDPMSKGGAHDIENVVPACARCNVKKRDTSALEFITGIRFNRKAA